MRVVDLAIDILSAHAELLHALSEKIGQENLLQQIEVASSRLLEIKENIQIDFLQVKGNASTPTLPPFEDLELRIAALKLNDEMETFLWTYPLYRALVESSLDFNDIVVSDGKNLEVMSSEARLQAGRWLDVLSLNQEEKQSAEAINQAIWLKFRARLLKSSGLSPFHSVK